jgi:DNA-binding transcriptional LysR family regulator
MMFCDEQKRPLDSWQLLSFVTVARTLSFTLAGKRLSLSQSAVSHAVKTLEDELGHRLLDRNGKNIQITPAGEHLLHYAEKILADMSAVKLSLNRRDHWGASRLRVGTDGSFSPCVLPGILQGFRREFPRWPVTVKTGDTRECVEWLNEGAIDVAIAIAPSRVEPVELTPLFTDEVLWIVAPNHPWAIAGEAAPGEIESQNYICRNAASSTSRLVQKYFERDRIRLTCGLELGGLEAVKEMVKAGAGITALAPWAARKELDEKSLVALPLGKRKLKRDWCLLRSPERKPGLAEEMFAKFSRKATNSLSGRGWLVLAINLLWTVANLLSDCFDDVVDVLDVAI